MGLFKKKNKLSLFATVIAVAKEKIEKINVLEKTLRSEDNCEWKKLSAEFTQKSAQCLQEGLNLFVITLSAREKEKSVAVQIKMLDILQEIDGILFDCVLYSGLIEKKLFPLTKKFIELVEENAML